MGIMIAGQNSHIWASWGIVLCSVHDIFFQSHLNAKTQRAQRRNKPKNYFFFAFLALSRLCVYITPIKILSCTESSLIELMKKLEAGEA
jgi:hypothetical protein